MLFCMHYFRRCHTASSGSPCRPNCIPGTPQRVLFLFFIDRTDGIIRTWDIFQTLFYLLFHSAHPLYHCLSPAFPFLHTAIQKPWREFPYGPLFGKHRKYSRAVPWNDLRCHYRLPGTGLLRHHPQCQVPRQLYLSGKTGASHWLPATAQGEPALLLPALGIERTDRAGHQLLREQPDTFLQRAQCAQLPASPHALWNDRQRTHPQHPQGTLGKNREQADKTHIRCNLLAALFMHIIPHYIPYCRSDHQNHFFGSHILPSET